MKRSTLAVITAGMILAGTGAVEILGDYSVSSTTPDQNTAPAVAHGDLKPISQR
ncbi:hypothetical protein [Nocardia vaccinii]|uniref:hypothetical protein n=1 Tax=Nocardia vaccinii TaxID=1822 RepID=UPI000AB512E6|nr:hypothetical protein [Nocardia vaccinii]